MTKIVKLLMKIPVPWIFVIIYILGLILEQFLGLKFKSLTSVLIFRVTGIVLFSFAVITASWSLIIFYRAHTTTTPGIRSVKLIVNGPCRISRNPMYVSLILAYIGEAGLLDQLCPLILLPLAIFYVSNIIIPVEEEFLEKEFKQEYLDYRNQVHRWL
jgi:protein-S-isoprenylcysteine O-methyltransferase Ste14